jgi:hypothetical protein
MLFETLNNILNYLTFRLFLTGIVSTPITLANIILPGALHHPYDLHTIPGLAFSCHTYSSSNIRRNKLDNINYHDLATLFCIYGYFESSYYANSHLVTLIYFLVTFLNFQKLKIQFFLDVTTHSLY